MSKLIEFSGTPDAGKTTLIGSLQSELESSGLSVIRLGEANGEELPPQNLRGTLAYNEWVGRNACNGIMSALQSNPDVLLVDRGFLDFRFWNYFYMSIGKASAEEVNNLQKKSIFQNSFLIPDLFIAVTVSIEEAIKRNPPLARKQDWVQQHNMLFDKFLSSYNGDKVKVDTSNLSKEQVLDETTGILLSKFPTLVRKSEKGFDKEIEL